LETCDTADLEVCATVKALQFIVSEYLLLR
jgi:hypothetical protein